MACILAVSISACRSEKKEEINAATPKQPHTIDIRNIKYSDTPQKLSLFVDSMEYVRIEDKPLIPDLWNVHIAEDNSGNIYLDFDEILKYDSNGHFLKTLFKRGQGPGEIAAKHKPAVFDMKNGLAYVPNAGLGYNSYTLDGEFVEHIDNRMGTFNRNLVAFWDNSMVSYLYDNRFPQKGESVNLDSTFFLQVTNKNEIVYQLPNWHFDKKAVFSGRAVAESSMGPVVTGCIDDSLFWMKPNYVDTVYCATEWNNVRVYYIIQKSDRAADYAWSVRARVGDITKSEAFKEMMGSVCTLKTGLLFSYAFDREKRGVGFCPANSTCHVVSQYFTNDIDEYCPTLDMYKILSYRTFYQKGNYLYLLVDACKFLEEGAKSPFADLKEDSNPILVKLKLKNINKLKIPQKESTKTPIKIDTLKIYEESEVTRAFPSLSNSENLKFFVKEYNSSVVKEGVRGRVIYDFVVERDGSISDVLIVEGLHTDVDNELIRVMKMLPPFSVPGKIDGVPVCSKFRATMSIR